MTRKPQRFAWDVYADQLYSRGLGYPLWTPERMREGWDVQPLDVGWIREGAFHHLLRATNAAYEDQPFGVTPKGHKPFRFDQRVVMESYRHPLSESRVVCSQSMSDLTFNPTDLSASHGWNMSFKNIDEEGAFLVHRDLWHTKPKVSSKSIEDYIRMNAQKWLAMANETLGIGLELSDLVFVSGCVRTSHWAVGAFSGASPGSSGRLNISEHQSLGPSVTGLLFSDRILPQSWWKNGHMTLSTHDATSPGSTVGTPSPTRPEASQQEVSTGPIASQDRGPSDGGSADATQCVFVNYYKAHRRSIFGKTIKAGAGYHELPPGDKDGGAGGSTAASTEDCPSGDESDHRGNISSSRQTWVDPLRHLLDYILDKSDAELAVACDIELYALFEGKALPQDLSRALLEMRPPIVVDANGTGTICIPGLYGVDEKITLARSHDEEKLAPIQHRGPSGSNSTLSLGDIATRHGLVSPIGGCAKSPLHGRRCEWVTDACQLLVQTSHDFMKLRGIPPVRCS